MPLLLALAAPGSDPKKPGTNSPLLFALKEYCLLVLLKVFGQALITGTLFSYVFLFSLTGTIASAALMYLLRRVPGPRFISLAGTGIAGAFVSNAVQLVLARFLVFGEGARYLAPPFLAAGILSGGILGLFAEAFAEKSQWVRQGGSAAPPDQAPPSGQIPLSGRNAAAAEQRPGTGGIIRLCAGLAAAGLFLLAPWLPVRAGLFFLFWLAAIVQRKKTRPVLTVLVILAVTAFNLFPPYGKVIASLGPVTITLGSLLGGLRKALTLEGLIMLSKVFVQGRGGLSLPGSFGRLLGESFAILEKFNEKKSSVDGEKPGLMERLDRLLCELANGEAPE